MLGAPYLCLLLTGSQRAQCALLNDQFEGMRLTPSMFAAAIRFGSALGRWDHQSLTQGDCCPGRLAKMIRRAVRERRS